MQKTEKAMNSLKSEDKLLVWNVLQEYLHTYREFINSLSNYTGLIVYKVGSDFFDNCTIFDIKRQMENVITFVYLKETLSSTAKESFKQCLKKC